MQDSTRSSENLVRLYLVHAMNEQRIVIPTDSRNYLISNPDYRICRVSKVMKSNYTPQDTAYIPECLDPFDNFFILPDPEKRLAITDSREHEVLNVNLVHRDTFDCMQAPNLDDFLLSIFAGKSPVANASRDQMKRLMKSLMK